MTMSGNDLVIGIRDPATPNATFAQLTDKITMKDWSNTLNRIETLVFSDGSTFNMTIGTLAAETVTGTTSADLVFGLDGADILNGGGGDDVIDGGAGSDTLTGGAGVDRFVYSAAGFGLDTIQDFWAGAGATDQLEFKTSVFANWQAVLNASTQVGADTVITLNASDKITLKNVTLSSMNADDARFVA